MSILNTMHPEEHHLRKFFKEQGISIHQLSAALHSRGVRFGYTSVSVYLRGFIAPRADVENVFRQIVDELNFLPNRNTPSTAKPDTKHTRISPSTPHAKPLSSIRNDAPTSLRKRRKSP